MIPQFLADMQREQEEASRAMRGVQCNLGETVTDTPPAECENQMDRCTNACNELSRISEAISLAASHVDQAANWWIEVETSLGKISDNISSIQADKLIKLRLEQIRRGCLEIKEKYSKYNSEVRYS
jgi:methyl-accepting chemotaxis protein